MQRIRGLPLCAWWRHQMEKFERYMPFVRGIHRSPVNSPHKSQWRGALMFSLICVWMNGWVNNGEAGYLRRNCTHYDVIAMEWCNSEEYEWKWSITNHKKANQNVTCVYNPWISIDAVSEPIANRAVESSWYNVNICVTVLLHLYIVSNILRYMFQRFKPVLEGLLSQCTRSLAKQEVKSWGR